MKITIRPLLYLPILFFFLPGFSFYIPGIHRVFSVFNTVLYFAILIMFCLQPFNLIKIFINACKKTPLIYYILFIFLSILNSFLISLCGITSFSKTFVNLIFRYILVILPIFIYIIGLLTKYLSIKQFVKIFITGLWINSIVGIIAYVARYFDISIINIIFDFLNNSRILASSILGQSGGSAEYIFERGHRLCGLYNEPGYLGRFLFIFLPFVYTFSNNKIKIFKNNILNVLFKRTIIPLTWINLILTLSPINLVFSLIITFIFYFKKLVNIIKNYFLMITSFLFLLIFGLFQMNVDLSNTYLARILNVIISIQSFDDLVIIEPSLATRLVYDINVFMLFLKHPIAGIGVNNIPNYIYQQCLVSPVTLTPEIMYNMNTQISKGISSITITPIPCFYATLAENGILISIFFFYFLLKLYQALYTIFLKIQTNTFEFLIAKSFLYSLICLFIEIFYEGTFILSSFNLILALTTIFIFQMKLKNNR